MIKLLRYIWPPAIIAIIIFYLCCLMPTSDIPKYDYILGLPADKVYHFVMFFALASVASFNYILINDGHIIILKLVLFAILLSILYGGLIEIIQLYIIENRAGDWYDFLADSLGAIASLPLSLALRKILLDKQNENLAK